MEETEEREEKEEREEREAWEEREEREERERYRPRESNPQSPAPLALYTDPALKIPPFRNCRALSSAKCPRQFLNGERNGAGYGAPRWYGAPR